MVVYIMPIVNVESHSQNAEKVAGILTLCSALRDGDAATRRASTPPNAVDIPENEEIASQKKTRPSLGMDARSSVDREVAD
jgi:hypothetical protein